MQEDSLCFGAVVRRLLPGAVAILVFNAGQPGHAGVLLFDSFGLGTTNNPRLDSTGAPVTSIFIGSDLSGIRAEIPNTSAAVWTAPGGHGAQSWAFTVSSADPNEPYSPFEPLATNNINNGSVTVLGGTTPNSRMRCWTLIRPRARLKSQPTCCPAATLPSARRLDLPAAGLC